MYIDYRDLVDITGCAVVNCTTVTMAVYNYSSIIIIIIIISDEIKVTGKTEISPMYIWNPNNIETITKLKNYVVNPLQWHQFFFGKRSNRSAISLDRWSIAKWMT